MGKKVLVLGTGAQGSTVVQRLEDQPEVTEVICADYDFEAAKKVSEEISKGTAVQVDASNKDDIVKVAEGCDLIVNGLPLKWHKNVFDAALEVKCNYQDFAATTEMVPYDENAKPSDKNCELTDPYIIQWFESVKHLYEVYSPKFKEIGKIAVIGTGSAPGLICLATRKTVEPLDTCDTINNIVYEGVEAKRFLPFWWSPVTALNDMSEPAVAVKDGKLVNTPAFGLPIKREYDYMGIQGGVVLCEHCHDEPLHYYFNRETHFKGAKNISFKYGGAGMDFARPLYRAGLLNKDEKIEGTNLTPFDVVLSHLPSPPKFKDEIKEILDEGLVSDTGCMVIECIGKKDGEDVMVETHVDAPGLKDSFEKSGITAEMYLTGQGGYLFTKMLIEDKIKQTGLISTDMLSFEEADYYFESAKALGITLNTEIKKI